MSLECSVHFAPFDPLSPLHCSFPLSPPTDYWTLSACTLRDFQPLIRVYFHFPLYDIVHFQPHGFIVIRHLPQFTAIHNHSLPLASIVIIHFNLPLNSHQFAVIHFHLPKFLSLTPTCLTFHSTSPSFTSICLKFYHSLPFASIFHHSLSFASILIIHFHLPQFTAIHHHSHPLASQ